MPSDPQWSADNSATGGGVCVYQFFVLTDWEMKHHAGSIFRQAQQWYLGTYGDCYPSSHPLLTGAKFLMDHFEDIPLWICCCVAPLPVEAPEARLWQYATLGSIYPATWSLMLALRARGLGSTWSSIHMRYETVIHNTEETYHVIGQGQILIGAKPNKGLPLSTNEKALNTSRSVYHSTVLYGIMRLLESTVLIIVLYREDIWLLEFSAGNSLSPTLPAW